MNFFKNKFTVNKKFVIWWCVIMSFTLAFFFTSNSPFYRFDTWADSGVYTQVGHSWLTQGLVPYKQIFDHKGPLHFLLFGFGSLLRVGDSYIGIYIIESLLMSISTYFYYKSINMFIKSTKLSLLIVTFIQLIIFTTVNFSLPYVSAHKNVLLFEKGGSPEEFCLPYISFIVYLCSKFSLENKIKFTNLEWLLFGLSCTFIFLEKFTLAIPFFTLFLAAAVWTFIKDKGEFKKMLTYGLTTLILPLIVTVVYFKINGAFSDFITYYFKVNLFNYKAGGDISIKHKLYDTISVGIVMLKTNYVLFIGFFVGLFLIIYTNKLSILGKLIFLYLILSVYVLSLLPGRHYPHYLLPIIPIVLFGYAFVINDRMKNGINKGFLIKLIATFVVVVSISLASANEILLMSKIKLAGKETSMETMAKIVKSSKHFSEKKTYVLPVFMNNTMIYTLTNTTPKTRFFYRPGMEIPQYNVEIINELKNKKPDYLVAYSEYSPVKQKYVPTVDKIIKDLTDNKIKVMYRKVFKNYKLIYRKAVKDPITSRIDYLFERK